MKIIIIFTLIVLGLFSLVAFLTNPPLEDYHKWSKTECYKEIKESTKIEDSVAVFLDGFNCDSVIVRDDFKFCSIYRVKDKDHYYMVLGAFKHFYVLNKKLSDQEEKI